MTLRLLGAAGAIAVAMALEPTSFSLTAPQEKPAGGSAQGLTPPSAVSALAAQSAQTPQPIVSPQSSATLSMVPVPKNPRVVAKLKAMLPPEMSVQQAAAGFQNQGQFVAAVQVSHNLEIPFSRLKDKVVREGLSLGQAIQALRPDANVSRELARARQLAAQ